MPHGISTARPLNLPTGAVRRWRGPAPESSVPLKSPASSTARRRRLARLVLHVEGVRRAGEHLAQRVGELGAHHLRVGPVRHREALGLAVLTLLALGRVQHRLAAQEQRRRVARRERLLEDAPVGERRFLRRDDAASAVTGESFATCWIVERKTLSSPSPRRSGSRNAFFCSGVPVCMMLARCAASCGKSAPIVPPTWPRCARSTSARCARFASQLSGLPRSSGSICAPPRSIAYCSGFLVQELARRLHRALEPGDDLRVPLAGREEVLLELADERRLLGRRLLQQRATCFCCSTSPFADSSKIVPFAAVW
jgi:hypothetical protein